MEFVKEVGAYAGFAAVVGLAVLAALYFSQARDVKRLREWAGRAPERAADPQAAGAVAPAQKGAVRPVPGKVQPAAARPVRPGQPPGAQPQPGKPQVAPGKPGAPTPQPATAQTGAAPAAATAAGAGAPAVGAPPKGGAAKPGAPAPAGTGAPPGAPPGDDRPGIPPATRPGRAAPPQTRVISREAAEEARRRAAERAATRQPDRRFPLVAVGVVAVVGIVLVIGGVTIFGGGDDDKPASGSSQSDNGGGSNSANKTPAVDPAQVTVAVLNGTTVEGLARTIGDEIQAAGFQLGNVTNAAQQGERAESAALYAPDHKADARAVARKLKISQIEPIDPESQALAGDATVVVIVGLDQTQ